MDQLAEGAPRRVWRTLLDEGPLSRAAIARATGLSKQSVSAAMAALEQAGVARTTGRVQGGLGRAAPTYEADPGAAWTLGIDLGGTRLRLALADLSGAIAAEVDEPVDPRGGHHLVARIGTLAAGILHARGIPRARLRGAAMAVAGVPDRRTGAVLFAPNLPEFDSIDVRGHVTQALGCPVRIENDVNMAAIGEQWLGRGGADFAFVAFGTGIGMGLVSGGRLVRGARGAAGEIAWLPFGTDPFDPRGHAQGPLESAIGSQALVERCRRLGGEAADVKAIFDALERGDFAAEATIDEAARLLALGLVAVRAMADPERVVLGGSVGVRHELIARVRVYLARAGAGDLPVEASELGGRAGLLGAVGLGVAAARAALLGEPEPEAPPPRRRET